MNFKDMGALYDKENAPPDCVLEEPLDQHLDNLIEFTSVVQALWFDSGPAENPTARSYVFYFFRGEIDKNRRPDEILTFKVKFDNPFKVHIVDKYLGGMAYGAMNAPALAHRHLWRPGLMSEEGKQEFMQGLSKESKKSEEKKGGCFIATAVFQNQYASEVAFLRNFRDDVISRNIVGRMFINVYYMISPYIARQIAESQFIKILIRQGILKPLIDLLSKTYGKSNGLYRGVTHGRKNL